MDLGVCADMNGVVIGDQQLVEVSVKVVLVIALTRTLCGVVLDAIKLADDKGWPTHTHTLSRAHSCLSTPPTNKTHPPSLSETMLN